MLKNLWTRLFAKRDTFLEEPFAVGDWIIGSCSNESGDRSFTSYPVRLLEVTPTHYVVQYYSQGLGIIQRIVVRSERKGWVKATRLMVEVNLKDAPPKIKAEMTA